MRWYYRLPLLPSYIAMVSYVFLYFSNKYYTSAVTTLAWILIVSSALSSLAVFKPIIQIGTLVGPYLAPLFIILSFSFVWHLYFSWISFAAKSTKTKFLEDFEKSFVNGFSNLPFVIATRELWESIKSFFIEPLKTVYYYFMEFYIGFTNIPKMMWNLFHTFFIFVTSLGGSIDDDLLPPIPPAAQIGRTKYEIQNGKFWKKRNENDIYFSLTKYENNKDNTFVSKEQYNSFRTFAGLTEDVDLKEVKII